MWTKQYSTRWEVLHAPVKHLTPTQGVLCVCKLLAPTVVTTTTAGVAESTPARSKTRQRYTRLIVNLRSDLPWATK